MNADNELKEFQKRFIASLEKANIKPADLSKLTGISKSTISGYYNGKRMPTVSILKLFAPILDVDIDWLVTGIEQHRLIGHKQLTEKHLRIIDKVKSMSDEELDKIETLIKLCLGGNL